MNLPVSLPANLHCVLHCQADEPHLQQIYTGYTMLARQGAVKISQRLTTVDFLQPDLPAHINEVRASHLVVEVAGMRIGYDVHDAGEVPEELLAGVDLLFKRSWEQHFVDACSAPAKVLPLGANLWVHADAPDRHALRRVGLHRGGEAVKNTLRALGIDRLLGDRLFTPRLSDIEAAPPYDLPPRVLFLAEAWNPAEAPTAQTADERVAINALRAACMRGLREALGDRVTCGFRNTPFAQREFADLVINDSSLTRKRNYLALVKQHPICIASSGLHRSIGWKFAEYLSMGRAIVSEHLHMRLPGDIAPGSHYLQFDSADSCVAAATGLVADPDKRAALIRASHDYYSRHLRPDALVAQSLHRALQWQANPVQVHP